MAYPCDLPANMGSIDIFRAIYAKLSDINPSTGTIEQKLDVIQDQLTVVNNSIEANTQAIKDISINVDIHSKDIQSITKAINKQTKAIENIQIHIDTSDLSDSAQLVAAKVEDGFVKTVEAIKSIQPGPIPPVPPRPVPPCPPPHPHPCPEPEPIFYPVTIGLPAPTFYYEPTDYYEEEPYDTDYCCDYPTFYNYKAGYKSKRDKSKCECNHNKPKQPKVIVPKDEEDWYHRPHNPYLEPWKVEYHKSLHKSVKPRAPKRVNCHY